MNDIKNTSIKTELIENNLCIVHLSGELDRKLLQIFEDTLEPLLNGDDIKIFILNCQNLVFIDSRIVGYIAYLYTVLNRSQRELIIVAENEIVSDILTLVGLKNIISSFPTVDDAVQFVRKEKNNL